MDSSDNAEGIRHRKLDFIQEDNDNLTPPSGSGWGPFTDHVTTRPEKASYVISREVGGVTITVEAPTEAAALDLFEKVTADDATED